MVYGFVKQSRGHVKIYSEVGHGTRITVYLPRAVRWRSASRRRRPRRTQADCAGHETILVVEDSDAVRRVAVNILRGLGYQVQRGRGRPERARHPGAAGQRSTCCSPI